MHWVVNNRMLQAIVELNFGATSLQTHTSYFMLFNTPRASFNAAFLCYQTCRSTMCVYIHIYIYIYTHIHIYTYTHIYIYTYIHIYIYTYMHICIYTYIHIYIYTYIHIHIIYIYIYVSKHIYAHMYLRARNSISVLYLHICPLRSHTYALDKFQLLQPGSQCQPASPPTQTLNPKPCLGFQVDVWQSRLTRRHAKPRGASWRRCPAQRSKR